MGGVRVRGERGGSLRRGGRAHATETSHTVPNHLLSREAPPHTREAEEECDVAGGALVAARVQREDAHLGQHVVHEAEHALLHLPRVLRAQDDLRRLGWGRLGWREGNEGQL